MFDVSHSTDRKSRGFEPPDTELKPIQGHHFCPMQLQVLGQPVDRDDKTYGVGTAAIIRALAGAIRLPAEDTLGGIAESRRGAQSVGGGR